MTMIGDDGNFQLPLDFSGSITDGRWGGDSEDDDYADDS